MQVLMEHDSTIHIVEAGKATKGCLKQTYVVCFSLVPVMVLLLLLLVVLQLVLVVSSWAWDTPSDTVAR